jgi:RHS repeat-associated protein
VNANGYLESITNPAGEAFGLTHTDGGLLTSVTDPRSNTSHYQYDDLGFLVRTSDPAGGFQTLTRTNFLSEYGVDRTTALGRTTRYRVGNLSTGGKNFLNTFPDGTMTNAVVGTDGSQTVYYPDGTVITTVRGPDPYLGMQAPVATSTTVKTPGGLTSLTQITSAATFSDPNDPFSFTMLTDTSNVNGRVFTSSFDRTAGKMTFKTPEGRQTVATIDLQGRLTSVERAGLASLGFSYDSHGRISSFTQGAGASSRTLSLHFDSSPTDDGLLDSITDPESSTFSFRQYDAAGRLLLAESQDAKQVSFNYDQRGNLTSITPPERPAHTFTYTPLNLVQEYIPPDVGAGSNKTIYEYNLDRQLEKVTRPDGRTVNLVYDPVTGQKKKIAILDGMTEAGAVTFSYYPASHTAAGNLASIVAVDGGIVQFNYDGFLLTGTTWAGAVSGSVGYTYDNNFQVTSETVNGGNSISFSYDKDGLLKQAGALVMQRDDPTRPETMNGLLRGTTLSNVTTAMGYNEFGELKDYSASLSSGSGPVTLFESHFLSDKLGRVKQNIETVLGAATTYGYDYDPAGRLWKVSENGALIRQYDYDANGNRLLFKGDGSLDVEYDNQDRLLRYANTTYTYTETGQLKTKTGVDGLIRYTYDALSNLTHVDLPNGTVIDYVIDGTNRRIGKKINGILVKGFLYKDRLYPVAELDSASTVVSLFVYGAKPHVPDYMIKQGTMYRIISDRLGSPRLIVDTLTGNVAQRMDYDEFGRVMLDTQPGFQPFGFAGGIYDSDTALVRFGVRDYDPQTGRWTSKDPVLFAGGSTNLYTYVHNDPVSFIDHSGARQASANSGNSCHICNLAGTELVAINAPVTADVDGIIQGETLMDGLACTGSSIGYCESLIRNHDEEPIKPAADALPPQVQNGCSASAQPTYIISGDPGVIVYPTGAPLNKKQLENIQRAWRRGKTSEAVKLGLGAIWGAIMDIFGGVEREYTNQNGVTGPRG